MLSEFIVSESTSRNFLKEKFRRVRKTTETICKPLTSEDCLISATDDTSPPKWHLAHTTWFFEHFILRQQERDFPTFNPTYNYLFNSYYKILGAHLTKKNRSLLSRPSLEEIHQYRSSTDQAILSLLNHCDDKIFNQIKPLLEVGINHEQQHQELLLMDIKQNFSSLPFPTVYCERELPSLGTQANQPSGRWKYFQGGLVEIGHGLRDFHYDNEAGRHRVWLEPFQLFTHLVTNGEYLEFIEAGGYDKPEHWLSDGWDLIQKTGWKHPLYWTKEKEEWKVMTLHGVHALRLSDPVAHVSYYEAQAFAHFRRARLPTEAEWETVAKSERALGHFMSESVFHPRSGGSSTLSDFQDLHGTLWEWTQSAYLPYPGFIPFSENLGEYNSKFMCNQFVLRGGSCVTPSDHYRVTYRNFYYPHMRWQFSGIRLARDGERS